MDRRPKVSLLIPTYNYARFLPAAIESVLAQDFTDYELIISDDASSDRSAEILLEYAARDSRIKLHLQSANLGMVLNWNWCLRKARGEYIKYVFGDDQLASPKALGKMVLMLDSFPDAMLAVSARKIIDEQSQIIDVWDHLDSEGIHSGRDVGYRCLMQTSNFIGEPSVVLFRAARAMRGFDPRYRQIVDLEMWCHLLKQGDLIYTKEPLCMFRCHTQQQTEANRRQQIGRKEHILLFKDYFDYYVPKDAWLPAAERKYLFTRIFYTRKRRSEAVEAVLVEQKLMSKLGRKWYILYWFRHRITRPFGNLRRAWQKYVLPVLYERTQPMASVSRCFDRAKTD
jgi:glycosyltransferase involved in cell wall biosynthesis